MLRFCVLMPMPPLSVKFDQVDAGHVDLEFQVNKLSLNTVQIDNNTYIQPDISGEPRMMQKGQPALPLMARVIEISSEGHISRGQNPSHLAYSFGSIYNQQEKAITFSEPYLIRNRRFFVPDDIDNNCIRAFKPLVVRNP